MRFKHKVQSQPLYWMNRVIASSPKATMVWWHMNNMAEQIHNNLAEPVVEAVIEATRFKKFKLIPVAQQIYNQWGIKAIDRDKVHSKIEPVWIVTHDIRLDIKGQIRDKPI